MADQPPTEVRVRPPLRCFGTPRSARGLPCGERASWMRFSSPGFAPQFFCDYCKGPNDVAIADDTVFRRITVSLDVMFAAVDVSSPHARAEVLARLEQLLTAAGGVLCVHGITEQTGRLAKPTPAKAEIRPRGSR